MNEVMLITGIGITCLVAETMLSDSGRAQEAKFVKLAGVSACLIVVVNLMATTITIARGVFNVW